MPDAACLPFRVLVPSVSGSGVDTDSIGSVDPDSESASRKTKMTHKKRKREEIPCFYELDVLFGGLEVSPIA